MDARQRAAIEAEADRLAGLYLRIKGMRGSLCSGVR